MHFTKAKATLLINGIFSEINTNQLLKIYGKENQTIFTETNARKHLQKIFELIKDRAIDILIYTPEELESISHRSFIKMIINEGKPIYEH